MRAFCLLRVALDLMKFGQHGTSVHDNLFTALGEDNSVRQANQQLGIERAFQLGDRLAGTRLGHATLTCCLGDFAAVGHGDQQTPMEKILH
ncbi:Uncharacterised protein [Serratia proteamaculans]|nr:Uncharacterised protein [Serratia proteamaculans]